MTAVPVNWRAFAPLAAFLLIAVVAGVVLLRGGARHDLAATGLVGRPAPAFDLAALDGPGRVTPASLPPGPYLVNVFASWCGPCRVEHPVLMELAAEGTTILGVAYKDEPAAAKAFLEELGDPYRAEGLDPEGRFGLEIGVAGVPETFVIGADGTILALHRGPLDAAAVQDKIRPALQAGAAR